MMGLTVLVLSGVTMFVYNSLGTALMVVMIAVGLLARGERDGTLPSASGPQLKALGANAIGAKGVRVTGCHRLSALRTRYAVPAPTLGSYARLVRSNVAMILALSLAGAAVGVAWQFFNGVPVRATVSTSSRKTGFSQASTLAVRSTWTVRPSRWACPRSNRPWTQRRLRSGHARSAACRFSRLPTAACCTSRTRQITLTTRSRVPRQPETGLHRRAATPVRPDPLGSGRGLTTQAAGCRPTSSPRRPRCAPSSAWTGSRSPRSRR